ncbi:MAG: GntG family PLP-dependent aldolase [Bacteroidales bacterium]|nr:GntG family PLP-dependent aldolase [Bacteroidales bacterium]
MTYIDLRSDTVTKPGPEMLKTMLEAPVGDDVFGEDPSVRALEELLANMFHKEAALFCPSGTMTNQIAIKVHTRPADEVICDETAHVYNFEGGGIAFNSGCSVKLIHGDQGRFTSDQVDSCINDPSNYHLARTRLVVAENTSNKGGGSVWNLNDLQDISLLCKKQGFAFHLDGARLFNAMTFDGSRPEEHGKIFDSISICLSKGLGSPAGSVLLGPKDFITEARRVRKLLGGAMRQSGYLAAAGIYALKNNVAGLVNDHTHALELYNALKKAPSVANVTQPQTNIVLYKLKSGISTADYLARLKERGILAIPFGPDSIRMVTHLDISQQQISQACTTLSTT